MKDLNTFMLKLLDDVNSNIKNIVNYSVVGDYSIATKLISEFPDNDINIVKDIDALSNIYAYVVSLCNYVPNTNYGQSSFNTIDDIKSPINIRTKNYNDRQEVLNNSLTSYCFNSICNETLLPNFFVLPLQDLLNTFWNVDFLKGMKGFNQVKVISTDLDIYLNMALDALTNYKEKSEVPPRIILTPRKDIVPNVPILNSSLEFNVLVSKYSIEYITKFIIIALIAIKTTSFINVKINLDRR